MHVYVTWSIINQWYVVMADQFEISYHTLKHDAITAAEKLQEAIC